MWVRNGVGEKVGGGQEVVECEKVGEKELVKIGEKKKGGIG